MSENQGENSILNVMKVKKIQVFVLTYFYKQEPQIITIDFYKQTPQTKQMRQ